jgi:transposase
MNRKRRNDDNELHLKGHELRRFSVIEQLLSKRIDQRKAALELEISTRQVRRVAKKVKQMGAYGVIHAGRGRESGNKISAEKLEKIKQLLQEKYADFGATLAAEKLLEIDGIKVSKESARGLLIELGLHKPKRRKDRNIHQSRERRPQFGELIQIDGSPHDWFEGRAEKCCLIVFIDDATSKITAAVFVPVESTNGYYLALQQHLQKYGLPICCRSLCKRCADLQHNDFCHETKTNVRGIAIAYFQTFFCR